MEYVGNLCVWAINSAMPTFFNNKNHFRFLPLNTGFAQEREGVRFTFENEMGFHARYLDEVKTFALLRQ